MLLQQDSDRSMAREQWEEAQRLELSVNLVPVAIEQLKFLGQVHQNPLLFTSPLLYRAIQRYEFCWLPLAAQSFITPPLDCAWVWHCHRLNPIQYAKDCKELFGTVIQASPEQKDNAEKLWMIHYPQEPYALHLQNVSPLPTFKYSTPTRKITYDLFKAVLRQKSFYYQVSEPHYLEPSFLEAAEKRYKGFLHLISLNNKDNASTFFVPTYDIDLMWHTHQLSPVSYAHDMVLIIGRVFEHDDTDQNRGDGSKLCKAFVQTSDLWERTYDKPYGKAGSLYRGEEPTLGGLGQGAAGKYFSSSAVSTFGTEHLLGRKTIQVRLSLVDVKNSTGVRRPDNLVVLKAMKHFSPLKLTSSSPEQTWKFEAELSTEGVVLYLKRPRCLGRTRTLGKLNIPWSMVLKDEMQTVSGWFLLQRSNKPRYLKIHVSATPPVAAPYIFRLVQSRDTDEYGRRTTTVTGTRWITRTAYDHANNQAFVIRCRYISSDSSHSKAKTAEVHVHQGGWSKKAVDGKLLAIGKLVRSDSYTKEWSLLSGSVFLTVRRTSSDRSWIYFPEMTVSGCSIVLLPGRKLDYAVPGVPGNSEQQEAGFVTVVRYSREAPQGVATALFNWRTGGFQINREENVLLVLLLASAIATSVYLMGSQTFQMPVRKTDKIRGNDHWGAFAFEGLGFTSIAAQAWWIRAGYQRDNVNKAVALDLYQIQGFPLGLAYYGAAACGGGCGGGCGGAVGGGGCGGGGCGGGGGGCGGGCGGGGCGGG